MINLGIDCPHRTPGRFFILQQEKSEWRKGDYAALLASNPGCSIITRHNNMIK